MNKEEFKLMKFNVYDLPVGTDIVTHFPELKSYKEFSEYKDKEKNLVFRYVFFCYDKNSPLIKLYPDLKKRKEMALDLAGFSRATSGNFSEKLSDIMAFNNEKVSDAIFCFLQLQRHRVWMMIVSTEQAFDEYQRLILNPVSDTIGTGQNKEELGDKDILSAATTKSKLMQECEEMNKRIDLYYKELFGDNNDLKEIVKKKNITSETQ